MAAPQDQPGAVERVTGEPTVAGGVLLDAAADLINGQQREFDQVERVMATSP